MSDSVVEVRFGGEQGNFLSIIIRGRAYRRSRDFWDGNWLHATATIQAGKFSGQIPGLVRAEEMAAFYQRLDVVYRTLEGAASFQTKEGWLSLQVAADQTGSIRISGTISDEVDEPRNQLAFAINTDPVSLVSPLRRLQEAVEAYPVYGKP